MKLPNPSDHHLGNVSARGVRGRKAHWAIRSAVRVRYQLREALESLGRAA
jgi:hypothetical protein